MVEAKETQASPPAVDRKKSKYRFVNLATPGPLDLEFLGEVARGLSPHQHQLKHEADADARLIPKDSVGVCLAVPKDSHSCTQVVNYVRDLEIQIVRIDYTYHQDRTRLDELIDHLRQLEVRVILHFIQPLEEGEKMPAEGVRAEWKLFIEQGLDHFKDRIEGIEIGSTINRVKWTHYTLAGFLAAWEVAFHAASARKLLLVGPNVTDFEPQYNAGILGMLKKRGLLPDVHSNNLFAERAIEPEEMDRKILGPRLKKLHGFDLKKKIRLLGAIAKRNGISRNWSTCAFWTLPRISRLLDFPEEQMADYVTRYFTLCLSEPAFERAYWGPLISCREGLIDDGTDIVPPSSARDVVSLYSEFPGTPETWRVRPAFYAFKAFTHLVCDSFYHGVRCQGDGLEIYEFSKNGAFFHVGWTMNGKIARISECYNAEDLDKISTIRCRNGEVVDEFPDFLSQSALYLFWPAGPRPEVLPTAKIVKNVVVAPLDLGFRYYDFKTPKWRGIIHAESREEAGLLGESLGPDQISQNEEKGSLRKSRNAIWTIADPRDPEDLLVVKKPARMAFHKRILDRNKPSKALRSWNGTSELTRRGLETPKVVAYFESTEEKDLMQNWFVCEYLGGGLSVRSFFVKYAAGETLVEGYSFEDFADELIEFISRLHRRGCFFRDLSGGNVLVRLDEARGLHFSLIDTARIRCRLSKIPLAERVADLKRLVLKLDPAQQAVFMETYLGHLNLRFTLMQRLSFKLYGFKAELKRKKRFLRKRFSRLKR